MDRNLRIRMQLAALDNVSRPLKEIAGGASKAGRELKATRDRLDQLNKSQADIGAFRSLRTGLGQTSAELATARTRAAAAARALSEAGQPTRKLTAEMTRAERAVEKLSARQRQQASELRTIRTRFREAGIGVRDLARHEERLAGETAEANRALEAQQARLMRLNDRSRRIGGAKRAFADNQAMAGRFALGGVSSIAGGVAVAAPIADVSREAITFEDSMADVRKVVDGLQDAKAFGQMSDDILALSTRLPMVPEQIAAIVASAGQAGIASGKSFDENRRQLLAFAEDATKMGIAFDITGDEAGEVMAKWRTAFGMGQDQVRTLADQVNYLGNTTAANTGIITDIVTRIGPLGEVGGIASGEIAALGATIAGTGVESEITATGIKNMMLALTKGDAATKSQSASFKALGLDAKAVAKNMQRDAAGTILDVMARLQRVPKAAQAGTLTQLFGSESVAAIAPLLTQLDTLRANFGKVADAQAYAGSMEAEYASRAATTSNALQLASNNASALKIVVGTQLLPTITSLAGKLGAGALRLQAFARRHPNLIRLVALLGAGLAGLMFVLGGLGFVVAGLIAPFTLLAPVAAAFGMGLLPIVGIALAIVAVIGLLGAAGYLLWSRWDKIKGDMAGVWQSIKGAFGGGIASIAALLGSFSPAALLAVGIARLLNWLGVRVPNQLGAIGRLMIKGLILGITTMLGPLGNVIVKAATLATNLFKQKMGIHSPSRVFMGLGGYMMEGLNNGIAAGEGEPVRRIGTLTGKLTRALAVGAAVPAISVGAMAGGSPAPAPGVSATGPAAAGARYEPHFHAAPGMDERELFDLWKKWFADHQGQADARERSSFTRPDDWDE